ncbi:MAG: efflux RND transporter periplasmic adaptor subunit [Myxococcota bacterium]
MIQRLAHASPMLLVAVSLAGCGKDTDETREAIRPARVIRIQTIEGFISRSFPGTAKATREVDLAFRVSGPLVALPVAIGTTVADGDLVARVDPRDFRIRLRSAESNLKRAKAIKARAASDLERDLKIQREDPRAIAQTKIDVSRQNLSVAEADIATLQAAVDAARDALKDTRLQAPFPATVVSTYVENFETIGAGTPVARLLDNTRIEFTVNIPESLITYTPEVTGIEVTFDAFPDIKIPAEVIEIGAEASQTTRTYPVTLILEQPKGVTILPGMAGRAKADPITEQPDTEGEIVIPISAVFSRSAHKRPAVWVVNEDNNSVTARPVTIAHTSSTGYAISSGINPGELIVTAGVSFLTEGQVIAPSEK